MSDAPSHQLELFADAEDDGSWEAWFFSLPPTPLESARVCHFSVDVQLTLEEAA